MASFTIYDPKTKLFRALETASDTDLPIEQVLLVNVLIELRVQTSYMEEGSESADSAQDRREAEVQEI